MKRFPLRKVHLDFHTSPFIGDVACEFDATDFARAFRRAHVESVTIFAKCHHGMSYYPTRIGTQHPALRGRDLMGEMIEALHREDIGCPIYTTIGWEEDAATRFPAWRQMRRDGTFVTSNAGAPAPGPWKSLNFIHPDYQDFIEAHLREILSSYQVDGLFFDILAFGGEACWSDAGLDFRRRHNLTNDDPETQFKFERQAQVDFMERFSPLIRGFQPEATIFYNSTMLPSVDSAYGMRYRLSTASHFEMESLPSGIWGYQHFPRVARLISRWGVPWYGMTGRFQLMWGDFGGVKPHAALEYECFRSQALGGGNSIGDQLPPRGILDAAAYKLIGAVYEQCAASEPFYENSQPLWQVGIVLPMYPGRDGLTADKSQEGTVQLCEEAHYECTMLDDADDISGLDIVILPDSVTITPHLRDSLSEFHHRGGKILLSHRSGFDADGKWGLNFMPLQFAGETERFPTYWRAKPEFDADLALSDRVFYAQGLNLVLADDLSVVIDRVLPYFQRTDLHWSSHFQTPPLAKPCPHPAAALGDGFIYFADPIFREYRQTANTAVREGWVRAMNRLVSAPPYGAGLPNTVLCVPRRRGRDLILTLLHYVPCRKALAIDVIDERMNFAGLTLFLPPAAQDVRVFGTGRALERGKDGGFELPISAGRLLLEVPGYFVDDRKI